MKYFIFGLIAALVGQAQAQAPSTWARVSSKNLVCRTFVDQGKLTFYIMQDNLGNALTLLEWTETLKTLTLWQMLVKSFNSAMLLWRRSTQMRASYLFRL